MRWEISLPALGVCSVRWVRCWVSTKTNCNRVFSGDNNSLTTPMDPPHWTYKLNVRTNYTIIVTSNLTLNFYCHCQRIMGSLVNFLYFPIKSCYQFSSSHKKCIIKTLWSKVRQNENILISLDFFKLAT